MARRERGVFHQLARELAVEDAGGYRDFFRVNSQQFEFLFNAVSHRISKQDTKLRSIIKPAERLAVTLRYLVTGETFKSLEYSFRISRTMQGRVVTVNGKPTKSLKFTIFSRRNDNTQQLRLF